MPLRSHDLAFRPRARLVSVLGEHLISDAAVGLIELVKNAYDADATDVVVEVLSPKVPDEGRVVVSDNGTGMTLTDLADKWLSPAVDHKERGKRRGERTPRGRLPIGEKGVGRFAVHQLGRQLTLITRAAGASEVILEVDWDRFDTADDFLDGIGVRAFERAPTTFPGDATGTRLEIGRLRTAWTDGLLRKIHRTLRRLQSPLIEGDSDFRVRFVCPEAPELQEIDPTDILAGAHYEFRAVVQPDGACDFEYACRHPAVKYRAQSGTENLLSMAGDDLSRRPPECGSFWMNLYVWDRSSNHLQATGTPRRELDAHCGVSLYRDNLRVLPYGEPGDDWLLLDQERIQAPAERIGNNQVIGLVLVDQSSNLQLRDKTNREGLIENAAFQDLRGLVRAAIRLFTGYWRRDRPATTTSRSVSRRHGDIASVQALASAIGETASDEISVRRPQATTKRDADSRSEIVENETTTQRQAVNELVSELEGVSVGISDQVRQRDILRQLAATGLAAERVVHEFGRQVSAAMRQLQVVESATRRDRASANAVAALGTCLRTLRNEFRVLAPYEHVGRADRMRNTSVADAANLALLLNQNAVTAAGIDVTVDGDDFSAKSRPAPLVQILDNLVHNAAHWVSDRDRTDRRIAIILRPSTRAVLVADSGPGLHPEMADHAFEAFTTMKVEGTGLGLFISSELADSLGCTLRLATHDERPTGYPGAAFVLGFPSEPHHKEQSYE